jgi:acetyl esterase/lipase
VQDVKAAVRWMRANAKLYGISPNMIGTLGGSSGAHMALLAGISDDRDLEGSGGNNNVSSRVQAVVAMAAPTTSAAWTPVVGGSWRNSSMPRRHRTQSYGREHHR